MCQTTDRINLALMICQNLKIETSLTLLKLAYKLHPLIAIQTSIKTRSRNREARGYQGIPVPVLHNHLVHGELDAWNHALTASTPERSPP